MNVTLRFCFLVLFLLFISKYVYAEPKPPEPVGRVVWVKGSLKSILENKEQRDLKKYSLIFLHDTLITDENSQAQIVFTDNSLITFQKNTQFVVKDYKLISRKKASTGRYVMDLIKGGFRTITGLIAKQNKNNYQVNTPVATIGVRGTDYAIQLDSNELYLEHYEGKPCIQNKKKKELCLDNKNKHAKIGMDQNFILLKDQPEFFKEKLEILPAVIAEPKATSSGVNSNSFCISQ